MGLSVLMFWPDALVKFIRIFKTASTFFFLFLTKRRASSTKKVINTRVVNANPNAPNNFITPKINQHSR